MRDGSDAGVDRTPICCKKAKEGGYVERPPSVDPEEVVEGADPEVVSGVDHVVGSVDLVMATHGDLNEE